MRHHTRSGVIRADFKDIRDQVADLPVEQTPAWYKFEESLGDRQFLGYFQVIIEGRPAAFLALQKVRYHGLQFLWSKHGPLWLQEPTVRLQEQVVSVLVSWVREILPLTPFIRLHLTSPVCDAQPPFQIVTFDTTVFLDATGTAEEILSRFSRRGRRNLRASWRKTPIDVSDETAAAAEDFSDYHAVMVETAQRQGFSPWPAQLYQSMLENLGAEHARLFAGRVDGELVGWGLFTVSGTQGAYYYAAANEAGRERGSAAQILTRAAEELGSQGVTQIDLMGIGSELAPSLNGLNVFKTAFAKEPTVVAPAWDVPVNKVLFRTLEAAQTMTRSTRRRLSDLAKVLRRNEIGNEGNEETGGADRA